MQPTEVVQQNPLARSPLAVDQDCAIFAMRMVKLMQQGPDIFTEQQVSNLKTDEDKYRFNIVTGRCLHDDGKGLDFTCYCKNMVPDKFERLQQCWKTHQSRDSCRMEVFDLCDSVRSSWSDLMLKLAPGSDAVVKDVKARQDHQASRGVSSVL
ncbi:hypothetical protein FOZ63_013305 [Perkinsus olseni]|uniref:Uncharacterized protein n=1 Tax=Perkinsus olseni TaxID=32597 RepID=A0A7J6TFJ1_PEROL|nr:hypothetical protein FOZ62_001364 [Perkinsus olseni]KAF4743893.1 hypothetical protein FOZ63_013305 [Perkinsus olseni]